MKILVTGAAGFIGSHLCEEFIRRGYDILGVDNMDPYYPRAVKERNLGEIRAQADCVGSGLFVFHEADILGHLDPLVESFGGVDAVCHMAAKAGVRPSIEDPVGYQIANVVGTTNLLEMCVRLGIEDFMFASSSSVYGDSPFHEPNEPISPYAASKRACELIGHTFSHLHGIRFRALRFFTVYGPRQRPEMAIHRFIRDVMAGHPITLYGQPARTMRDYTYIDDILMGIMKALGHSSQLPSFCTYDLGGGSPVTLLETVNTIGKVLGTEPKLVFEPMQAGDVLETRADIRPAFRDFHYNPITGLEKGIVATVEWIGRMRREGLYVEDRQ